MSKSERLTDIDVTMQIHDALSDALLPGREAKFNEIQAFTTGYILASIRTDEEPEEYRDRLIQMVLLVYGIHLSIPAKRTLQ